jgi:hypothetical protein
MEKEKLIMKLKHFLKPDHITVFIAIVLMIIDLYYNERILTLVPLLLLIFAVIYVYFEI